MKKLDTPAEVARLMLRATLKSLLARKVRLLLSGLAVVLGVMFVSGAFVLTDTLGRSFDSVFADAYASIDVNVAAKPKVALSEMRGRAGADARCPAGDGASGSTRCPGSPRPPAWSPPTAPG